MRTPITRDPSRIPPLATTITDPPAAEPAVKMTVVRVPDGKAPRAKPAAKAPDAAKAQRVAPEPVLDTIEVRPAVSEAPVPERPNLFFRLATSDYTPGIILLAGAISFINPSAGLVAAGAGIANALDVFGRVGRFVKRGAESLAHAVEKPKVAREEPTVARGDEVIPKTVRRGTAEDVRKEPVLAPVLAPASEPEAELHLPSHGEVPFALELAIRQAALGEVKEVKPRERKRKAAAETPSAPAEASAAIVPKQEAQIAPEVEAQLHADISAVLAEVDAERKAKRATTTRPEAPAPIVVRRVDTPARIQVRRIE